MPILMAHEKMLIQKMCFYFVIVLLGLTGVPSLVSNAEDGAGSPLIGWDEILDPDADCEIKATITITVPKAHDLNPRSLNAPRLLKQVSGEFTASVKVTGDFEPAAGDFRAAGMVLWEDEFHFLRLERGAYVKNGEFWCATPPFEYYRNGKAFQFLPFYKPVANTFEGSSTWFKITRRDDRIVAWVSNDGSQWKQVLDKEDVFAEQISVGPMAMSRLTEVSFDFEDFEIILH